MKKAYTTAYLNRNTESGTKCLNESISYFTALVISVRMLPLYQTKSTHIPGKPRGPYDYHFLLFF